VIKYIHVSRYKTLSPGAAAKPRVDNGRVGWNKAARPNPARPGRVSEAAGWHGEITL